MHSGIIIPPIFITYDGNPALRNHFRVLFGKKNIYLKRHKQMTQIGLLGRKVSLSLIQPFSPPGLALSMTR